MNIAPVNGWHRPPDECMPFEDFLVAQGLHAKLRALASVAPLAVNAAYLVYAFVGPHFPGRGRSTALSEALHVGLAGALGINNVAAAEAGFVRGLLTVVDSTAGWSAQARGNPGVQWRWEEPMWLFWNQRGVSDVAIRRVPPPASTVIDARRIQVLASLKSARLCEALLEHDSCTGFVGQVTSQIR